VVVLPPSHVDAPDVHVLDPRARPPHVCSPDVPLIALVHRADATAMARARDLGVVRCVSLHADVHDLVSALEEVRVSRAAPAPDHLLAPREVEVLVMICRGLSNAEIADEMFLSINSVKSYIRTAYRKIGVTRRAQAVLWGIRHGYDSAQSK